MVLRVHHRQYYDISGHTNGLEYFSIIIVDTHHIRDRTSETPFLPLRAQRFELPSAENGPDRWRFVSCKATAGA